LKEECPEERRNLLNLSDSQKADYGDMRFSFCNATVIIEGYGGRLGSRDGMACVRVETQERGVTSVVEYRFARGLNNVLQNRRRERTG